MSEEPSLDSLLAEEREMFGLTRIEKPKIKILLYTDSTDVVKEPVGTFGLGLMVNLLQAHAPAFADVRFKFERRYPQGSTRAENKIHVVLKREEDETGQPFDQIWFFGLHQVNKKGFDPKLRGGGPESELDADEVKALRVWMDNGGGVLLTGDHAELRPTDALDPDPNPPCPFRFGNEEFAGFGRALGRCVPRAGEMRDWDGPPTLLEKDSNDTEVTPFVTCGASFPAGLLFQRDKIFQELILRTFNEKGEPALGGQPHPLFFYRDDCGSIKFFPDHLHEGQVVIPDTSDETLWKRNAAGFKSEPRVVAYGIDKRNGNRIDLVAAYDGHAVGVGRIVADSSWHHYFNVNLSAFTELSRPGSPIDQIGQFYANLALWLSPAAKHFKMAEAMFRWLAGDPHVRKDIVASPKASDADKLMAGVTARQLLQRVSSPYEIHELLYMTIPENYLEMVETLYLPERGYNLSVLPSKELLLSSIINSYPRELLNGSRKLLASVEWHEKVKTTFYAGFDKAFTEHLNKVLEKADAANLLNAARLGASNISKGGTGQVVKASPSIGEPSERSSVMSVCTIDSWEMDLFKAGSSSDVRFSFINVRASSRFLTGQVVDPITGDTTPLSGTCFPLGGSTQPPDLSMMSFHFIVPGNQGAIVRIFMHGVGFMSGTKGVFEGWYTAASASSGIVSGLTRTFAVDPGDTGTGNGNQT